MWGTVQPVFISSLQTITVAILIVYFMRSNSTSYPLKLCVYEGMRIGFISFFVVTTGFTLNHLQRWSCLFDQFAARLR